MKVGKYTESTQLPMKCHNLHECQLGVELRAELQDPTRLAEQLFVEMLCHLTKHAMP